MYLNPAQSKTNKAAGYMLLEILVTVGILAVGLLGVSAMQVTSLKTSYSSIQRSEVALVVNEMSSKMRANSRGVYASEYNSLTSGTPSNASTATTTLRAQEDFDHWVSNVDSLFDASSSPLATITCPSTSNCILQVTWLDGRADKDLGPEGGTPSRHKHITSVAF
ncbi:MAG: type IV pilus assembly protein PilV [Saprospiraceae bacterium]|jgi:type IV pilus assembly protein PilV